MMRELEYLLDYGIKFLFIQSKANVLHATYTDLVQSLGYKYDKGIQSLNTSKENYDRQIKRYLGLGFLVSFVPGTEAFAARTKYLECLLELHLYIVHHLPKVPPYMPFVKGVHEIHLTPLYFLDGFVSEYAFITRTAATNITSIRKNHIGSLLSCFPLVTDVISFNTKKSKFEINEGWYKNLAHSLINPLRMVSSLLRFIHLSIDTFFELGADRSDTASLPRQILKGLSALVFIPLRLVVGIVHKTIDLAYITLDTLLLDPLRFAYEVVQQFNEYTQNNQVSDEQKGILPGEYSPDQPQYEVKHNDDVEPGHYPSLYQPGSHRDIKDEPTHASAFTCAQ